MCVELETPSDPHTSLKKWQPFLRQFFISSTTWIFACMYGMSLGTPTVMIPQLNNEFNSTDFITDDMASWISSIAPFTGTIWVLVLTISSNFLGRKRTLIFTDIASLIGFVSLYFSKGPVQILVSQAMLGITAAAIKTTSIMILTEYTSPKHRGAFSVLKSASFFWGIWIANALGTFFHWKMIALCGIIFSVYNFIVILITPESPFWLASNKRYEHSTEAHRWLRGYEVEAETELDVLIKSCKEDHKNDYSIKPELQIRKYFKTLSEPDIFKPILCCLLLSIFYDITGKLSCTVYSIQMIKKITTSEHTAYIGMLILDAITVISMYVASGLSKLFKRRILLLGAGSISTLQLYVMSCYLFLINFGVLTENKYVSIGLLLVYSVAACCGPTTLTNAIYGELIPVRSRSLCIVAVAMFTKLSVGTFLKIAPTLFKFLGFHGAFLFYAIGSSICIFLLYKHLPETKDKTMFEIAEHFKVKRTEKNVDLIPKQENTRDCR